MKFLVAPDKLKGSLTAAQAADCIAAGIRWVIPSADIDLCPIADGGEGTVAALLKALGGQIITRRVTGPLPEMKIDASFALLGDNTAVIEISAASGLALLAPTDRNPLNTTTFGTGELMVAAIARGAKKIILGLGGSATIDAGIGMMQACGFTVLTKDGQPTSMSEPLCGSDLSNILTIKTGRGEKTSGIEIIALADVTNALFGPTGAAHVYGPQKGASADVIQDLDSELKSLAEQTAAQSAATQPGAGAAGGLGFAVLAFLNGKMVNGFDFIANAVRMRDRLENVDLCITAEGRLDSQTAQGKAVLGVAKHCHDQKIPCIVLAGSIAKETISMPGITAAFSICDGPMSLDEAVGDVRRLLMQTTHNCMRLFNRVTLNGPP